MRDDAQKQRESESRDPQREVGALEEMPECHKIKFKVVVRHADADCQPKKIKN